MVKLLLNLVPEDFWLPGVHWIIEVILLIFLILFLWICVCVRSIRYFWKFPMPAKMGNAIAAGPYRSRVQPPSMIVEALDIRPGMEIVELGCGSGFYTIAVAKAIQPAGLVFAVDIQQGMLDKLKVRMDQEGVENIIPVLADAEGHIPLDDGVADAVFSITVLPEIPDPQKALLQVKRILKDDGIFVNAEFLLDPDFPLRRTVVKWARQAGFTLNRQVGNPLRHVLVFTKDE
ncbi:MAG: Demethylmenaquinone methyltransferase [Candidatus Thorarchaeota archaeon AB_25]|nr:MAG: Demethylmenaquinone methyltransferase [Candidatus Thorarchaeota archaeon AB_25]